MAATLSRTAALGGLLLAAGGAAAQPADALLPRSAPAVEALAGAWELISGDGARRCRLQLNRLDQMPASAQPAGARSADTGWMLLGVATPCRTTFPALANRNAWALDKKGVLHLARAEGGDAIQFHRQAGGAYAGAGDLRLEPVGRNVHGEERVQRVAAAAAALNRSAASDDPARARLAGDYRIGRAAEGAGCALRLTAAPTRIWGAEPDVWAAQMTECADEGLRIFAPAGWRLANDRIFLIAKKGHAIGFSRDGDGRWFRDPPAGRPLYLIRTP